MNKRVLDHRMKMLVKLVRRNASQKRIERAMRAHKKLADEGTETDATEEPERTTTAPRRAI